jgi:hypothetical protein
MSEVITCPSCQRKLRLPEGVLGQLVKCPGCAQTFTAAAGSDGERSAPRSARPDPPSVAPVATSPAEKILPLLELPPDESYQRAVLVYAVAGGLTGIALMVLLFIRTVIREQRALSVVLLLSPVAGLVLGVLWGFSLACLLAPRTFYETPKGRSWLRRIGTQRPVIARVACALMVVFTAAIGLVLFFFLWF